jgi:gluconolactonase
VGMRGGDRYPVLVRKTEPKPIRVFMQDGSHDQADDVLGGVGDWWIGNQNLYSALRFAGYQVEHVWGEGSHNGKHGRAVFPDGMRWLWKDWPQPVTTGHSKNVFLQAVSMPEENWHLVPGGYQATGIMAADLHGNIAFRDAATDSTWKISSDEQISGYSNTRGPYEGLAFGPDEQIYLADKRNAKITVSGNDGHFRTLAKGIGGTSLAVSHERNVYVVEPGIKGANSGRVWLVKPNGEKSRVDATFVSPAKPEVKFYLFDQKNSKYLTQILFLGKITSRSEFIKAPRIT